MLSFCIFFTNDIPLSGNFWNLSGIQNSRQIPENSRNFPDKIPENSRQIPDKIPEISRQV